MRVCVVTLTCTVLAVMLWQTFLLPFAVSLALVESVPFHYGGGGQNAWWSWPKYKPTFGQRWPSFYDSSYSKGFDYKDKFSYPFGTQCYDGSYGKKWPIYSYGMYGGGHGGFGYNKGGFENAKGPFDYGKGGFDLLSHGGGGYGYAGGNWPRYYPYDCQTYTEDHSKPFYYGHETDLIDGEELYYKPSMHSNVRHVYPEKSHDYQEIIGGTKSGGSNHEMFQLTKDEINALVGGGQDRSASTSFFSLAKFPDKGNRLHASDAFRSRMIEIGPQQSRINGYTLSQAAALPVDIWPSQGQRHRARWRSEAGYGKGHSTESSLATISHQKTEDHYLVGEPLEQTSH